MTSSTTREFDPTKPVQTRSGQKARIICTDCKSPEGFPIIALVDDGRGCEDPKSYTDDGAYYSKEKEELLDLVNVPEVTRILVFTSPYTPYLCSQVLHEDDNKEPGDQLIARKKAEGTFVKLIEFEVDK